MLQTLARLLHLLGQLTRRRVSGISRRGAASSNVKHQNGPNNARRVGKEPSGSRDPRTCFQSHYCCTAHCIHAYIANQLTCLQLGGIGDDGTYSLGDDALLCLKDLRKWLKFADTQLNRRDVARCMAESNLVKGDLLEILAKVSPRAMEDKWRHKIAVAARMWDILSVLNSADIC
jgi:hypothetical protein